LGGTITAAATVNIPNALQLNSGPGYVTFAGSNNITLAGVISGAGSIAFNMANGSATVTYNTAAQNTYTGVTNVIQGTLNVGSGGDPAWDNTTNRPRDPPTLGQRQARHRGHSLRRRH